MSNKTEQVVKQYIDQHGIEALIDLVNRVAPKETNEFVAQVLFYNARTIADDCFGMGIKALAETFDDTLFLEQATWDDLYK